MPTTVPVSSASEHETLFRCLYSLDAKAQVEEGTDLIFEHVDTLLVSGRFGECDQMLAEVDVGRLCPAWMRSLLTVTKAAEKQLPRRRALVGRISAALDHQLGADLRVRLLRNVA